MSKTSSKPETVRVTDGDRQIVLQPENNDLFVRTGRQVIEACRLGISVELWLTELRGMMDAVQQWAMARPSRIKACFCAPRGSRVVLFFVPSTGQFDFDLADELVELNGRLVNTYNVGMIETHQIPWSELDRFLDLDSAVLIHGDRPEPHTTVEA